VGDLDIGVKIKCSSFCCIDDNQPFHIHSTRSTRLFYTSVNIMLNITIWARIRTKYFIQMNNVSMLVFLKK